MFDTTVHKLDEFKDLPWDCMDPDRCSYDWSFGTGGHGLPNDALTIQYPDDKKADHWHIWELPTQIAAMVRIARQAEAESVRHDIRQVLGVN